MGKILYKHNVRQHASKIKQRLTLLAMTVAFLGTSVGAAAVPLATASATALPLHGCIFDESATTWTLQGNCVSDDQIEVTAGVTVEGGGFTISPNFTKGDNSHNAVIGITGANGVTIHNLKIDGTNGTNLHGINVYESTSVNLNDVTVQNNDRNGVVVNGSNVTVNNISTGNNSWGGIDVDLGGGVLTPAVLTVNGTSTHSENGADIIVDDITKGVTVNDTTVQYSNMMLSAVKRVYTLNATGPTAVLHADNTGNIVPNGGYTNSLHFTFNLSSSNAVRYQLKYWNDLPSSSFKVSTPWNPTDLGSTGHMSTLGVYTDLFTQGEGVHYFSFSACNITNVCTPYSATYAVTYDATAPVVAITNPLNGATVYGTVDVKGSVNDAHPDHYYTVVRNSANVDIAGPGTVNNTSSFTNQHLFNFNTTIVPDGVYTIRLEARDQAGNKDANSVNVVSVTVNNTPDNKNQCKNNGWKNFTKPAFRNQGACTEWVEHHVQDHHDNHNKNDKHEEHHSRFEFWRWSFHF